MAEWFNADGARVAETRQSPSGPEVRILPRLTFNFMANRKRPSQVGESFQKFMDGEPVKVGRSLIWTGFAGTVVSFRGGFHLVKLDTKPNGKPCAPFHAEILGDELETHL